MIVGKQEEVQEVKRDRRYSLRNIRPRPETPEKFL